MVGLQKVLIRLETDLRELRLRWALIGGLAVSARAEPRTTRDLDIAIAVADDSEAERVVADLRTHGYHIDSLLEQEETGRLATVRLLAPGEEPGGVLVDLLFASSGVETEIVETADLLEAIPGLSVPVATVGHLLALKVLARRPKDLVDIQTLLAFASPADIDMARDLLGLITRRNSARRQDLKAAFAEILARPAE